MRRFLSPAEVMAAGIVKTYEDWSTGKPRTKEFRDRFEESSQALIAGATLYNTLIGEEWFPSTFAKRIRDGKPTKILLLKPASPQFSIRQRLTGIDKHVVSTRGAEIIEEALHKVGSAVARDEIFRRHDLPLSANVMLFESSAYAIFLLHQKEACYPAVKVASGGYFYQSLARHFNALWSAASP